MRLSFFLITALVIATANISLAEPGAKGHGKSQGHGGGAHGNMSGDFRGVIHSLFAAHEKVDRAVEKTETGYSARTTSEDTEVAAMLQKHVSQMKSRLEGGAGVRHWDPAFVELREHYDDMAIEIKEIENGIAVSVIGKTPEAILVAQNHAKIISEFVEKGESQMHATHPPALGKPSTSVVAASTKASGKSCGKCSEGDAPCEGAGCGGGKKGYCEKTNAEDSAATNPKQ